MEESMLVAMKEYDEDEQRQIDEICRACEFCEECPLNVDGLGCEGI
jgi:hypothetical protein